MYFLKRGDIIGTMNKSDSSQELPAELVEHVYEPFYVDYEKQIYDLKQLLEISKSLNSTLDYAILIDSILFICMAQMKVIRAAIFAKKNLDATAFSLQRNYKGFDVDHSLDYSIPEDHKLITFFSQKYGCYTLDDIHRELGPLEGLEHIERLEPSLLVPLKAKGQINGILMLGERIDDSDFDPYEREYLLNIATLAAISINNAFLFEMTTTDMMTKLRMKHYLFTMLQERFNNFENPLRNFGIIMFDIDFFKKFNDTYGHTCGDYVLVQAAHIIADHIRSTDIAARFGGEEFVVLVVEENPSAEIQRISFQIAERIRQAIEQAPLEFEGQELHITISGGIACYDPLVDASPKQVVDRADRALYRSKQEGRNRISIDVPRN